MRFILWICQLITLNQAELTQFHEEQIIEYLNFARYKRNQHLREVEADFKEAKESR